jgi:ribose transport system ATP-binding protein
MSGHIAIRAIDIGVSFSGISVLRNINLAVGEGEIHGLIGENGAGKSTLGKVLGGYYRASTGGLEVFGEKVSGWTPTNALAHGVAIMHQELQLVPELTVAQNVFMGIEDSRWGVLTGSESARLNDLMRGSGFQLDPNAVVSDLSIADRQKIEIMRALARDAKIIVMDEPTSSLSKGEVEQLHADMKRLRDEGRSVIYVSHFLDDILATTDRITVLRDGGLVRTGDTTDETKSSLVSAMLGGGKTETVYPVRRIAKSPEVTLDVRDLVNDRGVNGASLKIGKGEIVGLIGLVGSGRSEIVRAIIGVDPARGGQVRFAGEDYGPRSVARSAELGMVMVPEDRRKQGLVMALSVRANMTLPHLAHVARSGIVDGRAEMSRTVELIEYLQVKPPDPNGDIANFSGGNQQKVLIGKWLFRDPKLVVLDEPSRGVDVGARERIHHAIAELAGKGTAVLIISSEIDEVLGLAHRAYLVDRGRTVEEIDPEAVDESVVLSKLFGYQSNDTAMETS